MTFGDGTEDDLGRAGAQHGHGIDIAEQDLIRSHLRTSAVSISTWTGGDIFLAHRQLHHKFPLSGGIPNVLLSYGKPDEVRAHTRKVIDEVARDGGYILDANAIMQNDTRIENLRAMTETAREHGVYSSAAGSPDEPLKTPGDGADVSRLKGMEGWPKNRVQPGVCFPWEQKAAELPEITGDKELVRRVWENIDALGNTFIWQCLLSF